MTASTFAARLAACFLVPALALVSLAPDAEAARAAARKAPLFKPAAAGQEVQDTLEVFVLYVQFKDETVADDVATTTGLGTFGSAGQGPADSDKKQDYKLDPNGNLRSYRYYLEKHFEFARNYFEQVSKGRVAVLEPRIFPRPDGDGRIDPFKLDRTMRQYNPSELDKAEKQKTSDFNEERAQRLMTFVRDAVQKADARDGEDNPFKVAEAESLANPNPRYHRCYMIFHAGHSRLLDGGQLGAFGADTPNDFTDFFVTKPDFSYLAKATKDGTKDGVADSAARRDSLGVKLSTGDTLSEIMMVSESASQDKLNWGINGILVNQLARQMGMPDMFDVVEGISQLGYFDLMDFAGANSENGRGFLPVLPSAWVRYYMGWETPLVARPATGTAGGGGAWNDYRIWSPAAGNDPAKSTTVKVPLNDREYLLVENRQRAGADDTITIYFSDRDGTGDLRFSKPDSVRIPFAFADSIFLDSIGCDKDGKKCKPNPLRPRGVITGASTYDLALPASGLLVWRVNEWFVEEFLKSGVINAYLGDEFKYQYKGVELVEADGSLTIGKRFKNALGQDAFDYGSGSDMFPHVRRRRVKPPEDTTWRSVYDTIDVIGPYGHANTNAWNDGRTHLTLEAPVPADARLERGMSAFLDDSVFNVRDSVLTLRVHWPDNQAVKRGADWAWPAKADTATSPQSLALLKGSGGSKALVSVSDDGLVQPFTPGGRLAVAARDTLHPNAAGYDSVRSLLPGGKSRDSEPVPVGSLTGRLGSAVGSAVWRDTVLAVLTADSLALVTLRADSLLAGSRDSAARVRSLAVPGAAGPVIDGDRIWVVSRDREAIAFGPDGAEAFRVALPAGDWQAMALLPRGSGQPRDLVLAGKGGRAALVDGSARAAAELDMPWSASVRPDTAESFTVVTADFDRDGLADAFLLGSRGSAALIDLENAPKATAFPGFPQRFARSVRFADTTLRYVSDDPTAPALADLNRDGHPDILFSGANSVHAVDFRGAYLKGWPFLPEERQAVGFTYGGSRFPETAIRSTPLVAALDGRPLVLLASPDGLIYAVDSAGRKLAGPGPSAAQIRRTGILATDVADWPLTMGGLSLDTTRNPYLHIALADLDGDADLELVAQSGTGSLNAWTLAKSRADRGLGWLAPGGDAARTGHLDVSGWPAPPGAGAREAIDEFYLFPSPVRGAAATVHLRLGKAARKARVRVYDIAGNVVKDKAWEDLPEGLQAYNQVLDLRHLGPDVYSALVEVWFEGGRKQAWKRFGVIR